MSIAPGYVHISVRNAQRVSQAQQRAQRLAVPSENALTTTTVDSGTHSVYTQALMDTSERQAATTVEPVRESRLAGPDNIAHGFVIYVGVDEETAAANGTSLAKMAQRIRDFAQTLVPQAQSYAAVAIAPADALGAPLDVVRSTFGDPTVAQRPRVEPRPAQKAPVSSGNGVLIDLSRREVQLDGRALSLTYKEFELLNYLVDHASRTVGREELLHGLWRGAEEVPNERTIDVHIRRLRSKLGRLANTVRTVRGEGYRFYEHPEVVVWAAPEYSI